VDFLCRFVSPQLELFFVSCEWNYTQNEPYQESSHENLLLQKRETSKTEKLNPTAHVLLPVTLASPSIVKPAATHCGGGTPNEERFSKTFGLRAAWLNRLNHPTIS